MLPLISESIFNPDQMTLDASPKLFSQDGQVSQEPLIRTDLPTQTQEMNVTTTGEAQPRNIPPEFLLEGAYSRQLASFLDTMTATEMGNTPLASQDSGIAASNQRIQLPQVQPSAIEQVPATLQPKKSSKQPKKSSKPSTVKPRVHT